MQARREEIGVPTSRPHSDERVWSAAAATVTARNYTPPAPGHGQSGGRAKANPLLYPSLETRQVLAAFGDQRN